MNLVRVPLEANSDGASAGHVVSYWTLGTCLFSAPVQTLRLRQRCPRPLQSEGHVNAAHMQLQVNPQRADGSASGCSMLSVGRAAGVGEKAAAELLNDKA